MSIAQCRRKWMLWLSEDLRNTLPGFLVWILNHKINSSKQNCGDCIRSNEVLECPQIPGSLQGLEFGWDLIYAYFHVGIYKKSPTTWDHLIKQSDWFPWLQEEAKWPWIHLSFQALHDLGYHPVYLSPAPELLNHLLWLVKFQFGPYISIPCCHTPLLPS